MEAKSRELVMWGRCWEEEGAPAYWLWIQSLRGLLTELDSEALHLAAAGKGGAFSLGRRSPARSHTYGYHRAEDVAGVVIVLAIGASAALIVWESVQRLFEPRLIDYVPWVIAAGLIGAAGNEVVARYRIRVGRRIGSEALVADGHHARTDALTSLTVVTAGVGAVFGAAWVDPAGLVVALVILRLLGRSARSITRRLSMRSIRSWSTDRKVIARGWMGCSPLPI